MNGGVVNKTETNQCLNNARLVIPPKDKSRILAAPAGHIKAMTRIVETVAGLDKLLKEQNRSMEDGKDTKGYR